MENKQQKTTDHLMETMTCLHYTDEVFESLRNCARSLAVNAETCRIENHNRQMATRFITNALVENMANLELHIQLLFNYYFPSEKPYLIHQKEKLIHDACKRYHVED